MAALLRPNVAIVVLESPIEILTARMVEGEHRRAVSREQLLLLNSRRRVTLDALEPVAVVDTSTLSPKEAVDRVVQSISNRS
jgi:hypothetical protein